MPTPLLGDRSAWDSVDYPTLHAKDIDDGTPTVHMPTATATGQTVRWNGTEWEAVTSSVQAMLTVEGTLTVVDNPLRIYNASGSSRTISKVFLSANTAPTGAAIIVDIHKDGVTIFTTQSNRPQIAIGANTGQSTTIEVPTWADGSYLTMHIDQIGSTVAGADLTVHIIYS